MSLSLALSLPFPPSLLELGCPSSPALRPLHSGCITPLALLGLQLTDRRRETSRAAPVIRLLSHASTYILSGLCPWTTRTRTAEASGTAGNNLPNRCGNLPPAPFPPPHRGRGVSGRRGAVLICLRRLQALGAPQAGASRHPSFYCICFFSDVDEWGLSPSFSV